MNKISKHIKISYIKVPIIIFYIALLVIIFILSTYVVPNFISCESKKGILDLSLYSDEIKNNLFFLKGEWEYYPNQLLYSEDFDKLEAEDENIVSYPHKWNTDEENFPDNSGYATYRLNVIIPENIDNIGIYSRFQYGAFDIYINGYEICSIGKVSKNLNDYILSYKSTSGFYQPIIGNNVEIIMHVQNYTHADAGFINPIFLGSSISVKNYSDFLIVLNGVTAGFLLVLVVYFIMIYIQNSSKAFHLNLVGLCVTCLFMTLASCEESLAYAVVPMLSSSFLFKLEYITVAVSTYFATVHIIKEYVNWKHMDKAIFFIAALMTGSIIIIPDMLISKAKFIIHGIPIIVLVAINILCIYKAVNFISEDKKPEAKTAAFQSISLLVLLFGILSNKLSIMLWYSFDLFPVLVAVYCFIQIFVLMSYYGQVESNLVKLTKTLEYRVQERTYELTELNKKFKAANESKSEFLARMSHEIRTPMNAIIGMSDLISADNLDEVQRAYFRDIRETSHSLLHIINDILDFSKIESGKFEITPVHFNFNVMIDNIISMSSFLAKAKELNFIYDVDDNIPSVLYGDEIRIRQIITNIISNAIKYTNMGFVKLIISLKEDKGKNVLAVSVSDTGVGIKNEDIPRLFNFFEQMDREKNRAVMGTGLGLAICKQLLSIMEGRIEVESHYGTGSTFTAYIPFTVGDEVMIETAAFSEKIYAENAKVLVVDDNSINITVAMGLLATHDIIPDTALSGFEAVKMAEACYYDIIFMDHMMPVMDGVETTQAIRAIDSKYKKIPIIALTANAVSGTREFLIENGMNDFLSKPIDMVTLNNILAKWLPKDKVKIKKDHTEHSYTQKTNDNIKSNNLLDSLSGINDINTQHALMNIGGNPEILLKALTQFVKEMPDHLLNLNEYLKNDDLSNYAILVHNIKGVLYNISAESLGKQALFLETASKNSDKDTCQIHTNPFSEAVLELVRKISNVLPKKNAADLYAKKETVEQLREYLDEMVLSCEIGDCRSIDKISSILKTTDFGNDMNPKIKEVTELSELMYYENVSLICQEIIKSINKKGK